MELYFKRADQEAKVFEIIDTEWPQYLFVFSEVEIGVENGRVTFECQTAVHKQDLPDHQDMPEEMLDGHAEKIINAILDSIYGQEEESPEGK